MIKYGVFFLLFFPFAGFHCISLHNKYTVYKSLDGISSEEYLFFKSTDFDTISYVPDMAFPEVNQMKTIRVNFHIMYDEDGSGNIPQYLTRNYVENLIANMNLRIMENAKMNLPKDNSTPVLPGFFRAELQVLQNGEPAIYHHNDKEHYWGLNFGKSRNNFSGKTFEKYKTHEDSVYNVFIQSYPKDSIVFGQKELKYNGISFNNHSKLIGVYRPEYDEAGNLVSENIIKYWEAARLLQHELGHTFGLRHSWTTVDGCADTPPNPNCWKKTNDGSACDSLWSNNLMDYNTHQIAMTPCQISIIQYNVNRESSIVRQYIEKDWCYPDTTKSEWIISHKLVIDAEKDFDRNIIIDRNAVLILKSRLSMPSGSHITVNPGGVLVLEGARLHNSCGKWWGGIKVMEDKFGKGRVILLKDSVIQNTDPVK